MTDIDDGRHQTLENLERLWTSGTPHVLPLTGSPWCEMHLEPSVSAVRLRTDYQAPEPDLAKLLNIAFAAIVVDGKEVAEITVTVDGAIQTAYGLLAAIADGVQLEQLHLAVATTRSVERFKDITAQRAGISPQVEIGLFGELLFFEHLTRTLGSEVALKAWHGPLSEEHDFLIDGLHVEVKTTSTEERRHVIHGLGQLIPVGNTPLALLSIQVTRGLAGDALTLPELISRIRAVVGGDAVALDARLANLGWDDGVADLFADYWTLRNAPLAFLVDDAFPALTLERLSAVPNLGLVSDVTYRVDVAGLKAWPLPAPHDVFSSHQNGQ